MERKSSQICLCVALLLLVCTFPATGLAAGVAWNETLDKLQTAIVAVAQTLSAISIAVCGMGILLDAGSVSMGRMFKLVLGVTLVGNIAWLFFDKDASLFGYYIQSFQSMANANYPAPLDIDLSDQAQGINFVGLFVTYFERICLYGAAQLMPIAFKLLMALAVIDITIELMFKLEGDHIQYLLHEIFKVGFFIFLIGNWITGTNLMNQLFVSFEQIGITASGVNTIVATSVGEEQIVPQSVLLVAFKVVNAMYAHAPEWKFNIIAQLVQVVVMLASFILICLMAVKIVILRMSFWLVAMITVPLIPFGAFKHTRFIFERVIGAMFNLGIRNAVLTFLMCIIGPILQGLSLKFANSSGFMDNIVSLLLLLFACILLYTLVLAADGMAAGLLSGNPNLSSGDLVQTARSAGRKVMGTVDTAAAAAGVIQSARTMQGGDATTGGSKMGTAMNLRAMGAEYMKQNAPVVSSFIDAKEAMRDMLGKRAERTAQDNLASEGKTVGWTPEGNNRETQLEKIAESVAALKKAFMESQKNENSRK